MKTNKSGGKSLRDMPSKEAAYLNRVDTAGDVMRRIRRLEEHECWITGEDWTKPVLVLALMMRGEYSDLMRIISEQEQRLGFSDAVRWEE